MWINRRMVLEFIFKILNIINYGLNLYINPDHTLVVSMLSNCLVSS